MASATLAQSPRLRSVLSYLLASVEDGTIYQVTEQSIGNAVFGRPLGYNASEDNIVRVTVRHLRTRLEEYYRGEGSEEKYRITIPKGKYIPLITSDISVPIESTSDRIETPQSTSLTVSEIETNRSPEQRQPRYTRSLLGGIGLLCLICTMVGYGLHAVLMVKSDGSASKGLWRTFGSLSDPVFVIVPDGNLQIYRTIFGKQVSLEDYIARTSRTDELASGDPRMQKVLTVANGGGFTTTSGAFVAADIKTALRQRPVTIKNPHELSMRDFREPKNIILLGGPWINPWGQLFETGLKYQLQPQPQSPAVSYVSVQSRDPGDPEAYFPHKENNQDIAYARLAILPNFTKTGHIVLLGSTDGAALESGAQALGSEDDLTEIFHRLNVPNLDSLPPIEFILEVRSVDGVPESRNVIAIHAIRENNAQSVK
jgi:hypothetical protein